MTAHHATRRWWGRRVAIVAGCLGAVLLPALTLAHPLGNFTINHFVGIRVGIDRIALDVVIDRAEIPAFQERQRLDADGDGAVSATEIEAARTVACSDLAVLLTVEVAGSPVPLLPAAAGLSFPPGAGGLTTMRLVCEYVALPASQITAGAEIAVRDGAFPDRIGWREIVLVDPADPTSSASAGGRSERLTAYPKDLLAQPLDMRAIDFAAQAPSAGATDWSAPDAASLIGAPGIRPTATSEVAAAVEVRADRAAIGAVPGGVGSDLSAIVGAAELTPAVILASLLIAIGLGAAHALSPGHGKTIMAAYLVGTRGTARHAIGLGLTVTVSHTIGVLALAGITLLAADVLPPERLYPILGVASGALVVVIGGSLLVARARGWAASRAASGAPSHERTPRRAHEHTHEHAPGHAHEHAPGQAHAHEGAEPVGAGQVTADGLHSHGGRPHRHLPDGNFGLSWRSLFALGLSGGLVPSASALILLLGSIATGRVAYGLVLVLGFGVGMAVVLGGVGLILVRASHLLSRLPTAGRLAGASGAIQLATSMVVIALGMVLTSQALTQVL